MHSQVWVPVTADGVVPVVRTGLETVVVGFGDEQALPEELPPGCAEWQGLPVDQLALVVPEDVALWLEPEGEVVDLGAARERAMALVRAAIRFREGVIGVDELLGVFRRAVVYCEAAERPGFVARAGVIPVFSSLVALAQVLGDTSWLSATGHEVLARLPGGYRLMLDPGASHSVVIPS